MNSKEWAMFLRGLGWILERFGEEKRENESFSSFLYRRSNDLTFEQIQMVKGWIIIED